MGLPHLSESTVETRLSSSLACVQPENNPFRKMTKRTRRTGLNAQVCELGVLPAPLACTLTAREYEIATLTSAALSNKEIARRLGVTEGTVKAHLHNIYQKVDVQNRAALTLRFNASTSRFNASTSPAKE
jgi:DNA-binding NarL/FixJ family response regulator